MQTLSEFRFPRFASLVASAAFAFVAACGGPERATGGVTNTCTIALSASTDDAHLQAAIESALRRQDPCSLPDPPLRTAELRSSSP